MSTFNRKNKVTDIIASKKNKTKKKKASCLKRLCFLQHGFYFSKKHYNEEKEYTFGKEDMKDLPDNLRYETIWLKVKTIIENGGKDGKPIKDVDKIITKINKRHMNIAVGLRILQSIISVSQIMLIKFFLKEVKYEKQRRASVLLIMTFAGFLMAIMSNYLKNCSEAYLARCKLVSEQVLRSLFFHKISKANSNILEHLESSIVEKIASFDFKSLITFVQKYPQIYDFPDLVIFSTLAMSYFIGWISILVTLIFTVFFLIIYLMADGLSKSKVKSEFFGSERSRLMSELLVKFRFVKEENMEIYFKERLNSVRHKEIHSLHHMADRAYLIDMVMALAPFCGIFFVLFMKVVVLKTGIDIYEIYALVTIVTSIHKKLKGFVEVVEQYYHYRYAIQHFNALFFVIPERNVAKFIVNDPKFPRGRVMMKSCRMVEEDEEAMKLALNAILGWTVNLQMEKEEIRKEFFEHMKKIREEDIEAIEVQNSFSSQNLLKKKITQELNKGEEAFEKKIIKAMENEDIVNLLESEKRVLFDNLNLVIEGGKKVCFSTEDDRGLTRFLKSFMGVNQISEGEIRHGGKVIYFSARSSVYLNKRNFRDNILFGEPYNRKRYKRIIRELKLDAIFDKFREGDLTEVVMQCDNLSSYERRDLLLARFAYQRGEIYILDGFFGHETEQKDLEIISKLTDSLLKDKTLILKSNSTKVRETCDLAFIFKNGKVSPFRKNNDDEEHSTLIHDDESEHDCSIDSEINQMSELRSQANITPHSPTNLRRTETFQSESIFEISQRDISMIANEPPRRAETRRKSFHETEAYHKISRKFFEYFFMGGKFKMIVQTAFFLFTFGLFVFRDYWIGAMNLHVYHLETMTYLKIIFGVWLLAIVLVFLRDKIFHSIVLKKSELLYKSLIDQVFNLTLGWMMNHKDTRIWYKVVKDMRIVDEQLNHSIHHALDYVMACFGIIIVINWAYFFTFMFPTIILFVYIFAILHKFVKPMKRILEFQANAEEEMFTLLLTAVQEHQKYRLIGKSEILEERFKSLSNSLLRCKWHTEHSLLRWIGIRQMIVNAIIILIVYLLPSIVILEFNILWYKIEMIDLAFAVVWSNKFEYYYDRAVEVIVDILKFQFSYNRIQHFLLKSKREKMIKRRMTMLPGRQRESDSIIKIKNITIYQGERKLLDKLNFEVKKGSKVAVIGPHGAGKHTFFELVLNNLEFDMESNSCVKVLGYDFRFYSGESIKRKITFLCKHPMTYSGKIKDNIDPEGKFRESKIFKILHTLGADKIIEKTIQMEGDNGPEVYIQKPKKFLNSTVKFFESNMSEENIDIIQHPIEIQEDIFESARLKLPRIDERTPQNRGRNSLSIVPPRRNKKRLSVREPLPSDSKPLNEEMKELYRNFLKTSFNEKNNEYPLVLRKLIKLTRALLEEPSILLIDEPAIKFNHIQVKTILRIIEDLMPKCTVLIIVDNFISLFEIEETVIMKDGKVLERGAVGDLINDPNSFLSQFVGESSGQVYQELKEVHKAIVVTSSEEEE